MTNPTLDDRVREFLELAENVDHAPWTQTRGTARMSGGIHNCDGTILLIVYGDRSERELALGQFICAARNDAPALIRELQAEVERLREIVTAARSALSEAEAERDIALRRASGHAPECGGLDYENRRCGCGYLDGELYRDLVDERDAYCRVIADFNRQLEEAGIGPGRRYPTIAAMAEQLWQWHDEAQAEKMHAMAAEAERDRAWNDAIESAALCALSLPGRPTWQAADAIRALALPGAGEKKEKTTHGT